MPPCGRRSNTILYATRAVLATQGLRPRSRALRLRTNNSKPSAYRDYQPIILRTRARRSAKFGGRPVLGRRRCARARTTFAVELRRALGARVPPCVAKPARAPTRQAHGRVAKRGRCERADRRRSRAELITLTATWRRRAADCQPVPPRRPRAAPAKGAGNGQTAPRRGVRRSADAVVPPCASAKPARALDIQPMAHTRATRSSGTASGARAPAAAASPTAGPPRELRAPDDPRPAGAGCFSRSARASRGRRACIF